MQDGIILVKSSRQHNISVYKGIVIGKLHYCVQQS